MPPLFSFNSILTNDALFCKLFFMSSVNACGIDTVDCKIALKLAPVRILIFDDILIFISYRYFERNFVMIYLNSFISMLRFRLLAGYHDLS